LPSARQVAIDCFPKYEQEIATALPPDAEENLEIQAQFAFGRNELQKLFLAKLVYWRPFFRNPNKGHAAVGDMLATGAARCAITTNFDFLVEQAAEDLGEDVFRSALDGVEGNSLRSHRPYMKIHGCARRDLDNTLWCKEQITAGSMLETRIESCKTWLQGHLLGKDLLLVGFWSDWDYLINIFEDCITGIEPKLVVAVDPQPAVNLETKAPALWEWANAEDHEFHHAQESGADFLEQLRRRFSIQFLERLIDNAKPAYNALMGKDYTRENTFETTLSTDELYTFRRDVEGKPPSEIARAKVPTVEMQLVGTIQMRLIEAGAAFEGARFVLNFKSIRVLQGAGGVLSLIRKRFEVEQSPLEADIVVCAGAVDDGGAPASIVRGSSSSSIIKPAVVSSWMNDRQAVDDLGI
jgi:hypothetical protein